MNIGQFLYYLVRYANVWCLLAIVECLFVIISTRENHIGSRGVKSAVYRTGSLIIFAAVADMVTDYAYGIASLRQLVFLGYTIVYTIPMIVPIVYSSAIDPTFLKSHFGRVVLVIAAMYVISMLTNFKHGLYFYVDAGAEYIQGSVWYIRPVLLAVNYFAIFAEIIKKKYILSMGEIKTVNHLLTLFIVGVIYTDIFYTGEIIELIMASGFSFITSMFNNLELKTDQVTGLANRAVYTQDAFKCKDFKGLVVVSIDINDLKKINDKDGHAIGDAYLRASALTYNRHLGQYGKLYRIGGDEFVFLGADSEAVSRELELLQAQKKTDAEFGDFPLSVAYGLVEKEKEETVFDAVNRADTLMYKCKRRMKNPYGNIMIHLSDGEEEKTEEE
ncbi:diguanylate cyclase (GGDEF) domain-containing protein [Lachnospiraceae bacterium JC7]|nr:diguanylate cyclase (GGDEF) domain-containing protein [Lachnospiraceae bacterium JC7]